MGSVQRGGIIRSNDNGTLERIDGTNTYVGSATLESGKVLTKRFRCQGFDEDDVARRWLKWQGKNVETKEETMAKEIESKKSACPFSGQECGGSCPMYSAVHQSCSVMLGGIGLYNIAQNIQSLDASESIELVAMAVGELGGKRVEPAQEPVETPVLTVDDGVSAYLDGKSFLAFVNLHSKTVYAPYKRFCEEKGFPSESESGFSKALLRSFPELKAQPAHGGKTFVAA